MKSPEFKNFETAKETAPSEQEKEQQVIEEKIEAWDSEGFINDTERNDLFGIEDKNVVEALARLTLRLEKKLADYDTIIGDDVSGRLVARFFRRIIKTKRQAKGLDSPQSLFVAGGRGDHEIRSYKILKFFEKKKSSINKALLVTEYIGSGEGLNWLVEIIANFGIDFDLASLSIESDIGGQMLSKKYPEIQKRLIYGLDNRSAGLFFYDRKYLTGVEKDRFDSLVKDKEKITAHTHPDRQRSEDNYSRMKSARQSLDALADEICDKLLTK